MKNLEKSKCHNFSVISVFMNFEIYSVSMQHSARANAGPWLELVICKQKLSLMVIGPKIFQRARSCVAGALGQLGQGERHGHICG